MSNHPPVGTGPKGIDITDLIDYRAKGLTMEEIGKLTGCSHANVSQRLAEAELESLDRFETHKAKGFEHLQRRAIKNITDEELKKASPASKVLMAGILQDKIMALRGQATEIIDHQHLVLDLSEAIKRLKEEQERTQAIDITES